jgi:uncharacterized protein YggE
MRRNFRILLLTAAIAFCFAGVTRAQMVSISGSLTPTVEAGGWLIVDGTQKYLLLNAAKYSGEGWFKAAAQVSATGELKPDAVTIYQEGTPFVAATLTPVQTPSEKVRPTTITVLGSARVTATPDTALLSISVVTQNPSALEAQQLNATQSTAVIDAIKAAAPAAEIQTSGYALIPQRVYKENLPPTISGYEARNTVTATLSDLTRVGAVIDAAAGAGANNIDGVSFTLRRDSIARTGALANATLAAVAKANALASTLESRVVRVIAVQEGGTPSRPIMRFETMSRTAAADTPIEPGTLEITADVVLIAEVEKVEPPR